MPAWFDLTSLENITDPRYDDEPGLQSSMQSIDAFIQAEVDAGIPEDKIVVAGFSQGGALSILTGLSTKRKLGGIGVMSAWVPLSHKVPSVSFTVF